MKPAGQSDFLTAFLREVFRGCYAFEPDNVDFVRFKQPRLGAWKRLKGRAKAAVIGLARKLGFAPIDPFIPRDRAQFAASIVRDHAALERTYDLLADEASRHTLVLLLALRALGHCHIKMPVNTPSYWRSLEFARTELLEQRGSKVRDVVDGALDLYDLDPAGVPVRLHAHVSDILNTFLLQQYRYDRQGAVVEAESGDVVLDCGSCWGDAALYFARRAGAEGRVYAFEFVPDNLAVVQANLDMNPELGERITVVREAVWDTSGKTLRYTDNGPGTRVGDTEGAELEAPTRAIDDLVAEEGLERVDFLKMDIEGAELRGLRGAEQTLRRFRPKLAISVYHSDEDLVAIPAYLDGLGLGYEFFLDHFTVHFEETILFARPESPA